MKYQFMRFPEGKLRALTLSYDDGPRSDIRFSDAITSYGLKCTFNMNGDGMRGAEALSKETIERIVFSRGHELALHGYYHSAPGRVRTAVGIKDVLDNRVEMEKKYGRIIRGMAYPDSGTNVTLTEYSPSIPASSAAAFTASMLIYTFDASSSVRPVVSSVSLPSASTIYTFAAYVLL